MAMAISIMTKGPTVQSGGATSVVTV